jgi:hypothetical protein
MFYFGKHIDDKLEVARAVSAGVIEGRTGEAAGHTHRFAVAFIDEDNMFYGSTSKDGQGAHIHYIAASVYDVVNTDQKEPRTEEIAVEVNKSNLPENVRSILDFYNMTEIRLVSSPSYHDEHTHTLVVRYADANIDKMGRKVTASEFTEGLRKSGGSFNK